MTLRQIEKETGIPARTVGRWLNQAGVTLRRPGQTAKTAALTEPLLRDLYERQDKSAEQIAKQHGTTPETVRRLMVQFGIQIRRTNKGRKFDPAMHQRHSEWLKGRFAGDKNPNWRGAKVSKYQRDRASFQSKEWSRLVRQRDGRCMDCGSYHQLHAHHLVEWRKNAALRYDVNNGVTLCATCHQARHKLMFPDWVTRKTPRAQDAPSGR